MLFVCNTQVIVTGVLKLPPAGIFSGANMFHDVFAENPEFSTLFGFTEREIRDTYGARLGENQEAIMAVLKEWYGGYRSNPRQVDCMIVVSVCGLVPLT
jgi:hypothetical protein